MPDDVRAIALALLDAWNSRDPKRAAMFYAPDYVGIDIGQRGQQTRRDRLQTLAGYVRAFPDVQWSGDTMVEGDRVTLIWTMRGTHQGAFMRIPPTGRSVEVRGVSIITIAEGKIVHGLTIWDAAGLLRSLGLLPAL